MKRVVNVQSVHDYNTVIGIETLHPLVSVVDFSKAKPEPNPGIDFISFEFYAVFLKHGKHCTIRYGRNYYDYQDGTLIFIAPGQVVNIEEDGEDYQPEGYAMLFHPDMLFGTSLAKKMKEYSFFSYDIHEALHISLRERQIVLDCFSKISQELNQSLDRHSNSLIVSNIELFLGYCARFYDRQFISRNNINKGISEKFEALLHDYFQTDKPQVLGPPSVKYCAEQLHLSPNYFGDLIKKKTGKSAQEQIHSKVIDVAKERIFDSTKSISEIAYELGFKYPHHFSRFFKQRVGYSPNAYRTLS
ncbi:helix-turn-helix domain-containing protein [Flexithrix dorotheae]|uniref:helix-turn-helix domain-containing protein n=1 Tax=Flexithrix dorotheae TaxID=70993 RepID=UPI00037D68A2|nr:AraC family transcriptional regulator [Flexithrix dorotheae]